MPFAQSIDSIEALLWLERADGKERVFSESSERCLSTEELLLLVRELYAAGATTVLALDIEIDAVCEDANYLKVILPEDPDARAALFAIEARVLAEIDSTFEPEEERNQASFLLSW